MKRNLGSSERSAIDPINGPVTMAPIQYELKTSARKNFVCPRKWT